MLKLWKAILLFTYAYNLISCGAIYVVKTINIKSKTPFKSFTKNFINTPARFELGPSKAD
jgi:hypothetical protein